MDELVENGVEQRLSYCSSNMLVEDTSVLGPGVLSVPHNRERKFGACSFLLWRIKWHLRTHAGVCACSLCTHTHTNSPSVQLGRAQRCVFISACLLLPQWWLLLCISNRRILVLSSWNETYSPKELKRREIGRVSERNMKSWVPEAAIQIFFFLVSFSKKIRVK